MRVTAAVLCFVLAIFQSPQIDSDSQKSVAILRQVAQTIKGCPIFVESESRWGKQPNEISQLLLGPPQNVIWDVKNNESVRSPYVAYIELSLAHTFRVPADSLAKFEKKYPDLYAKYLTLHALKNRYEFDLGPNGIEVTKTLIRATDRAEWEAAPKTSACWYTAANSPK